MPQLRIVVSTLLAALLPGAPVAAQQAEQARAESIERMVDSLGRAPLWPGYEPLTIPLAIYTGSATWLFRHPAPPEGFEPVPGASLPSMHRFEGRHPAATANSSADIGGVSSATLLADGARAGLPADAMAATALHEAFHVFQRAHHPSWSGNEGDLLLYPFDDARLLALRREESLHLQRALAAADDAESACHARRALDARTARFGAMDSAFATYERASELNEGLATWVQLRSLGRRTVAWPDSAFPSTALRDRFYVSGPSLAFLLNRFRPGWTASLEARDTQTLDGILAHGLPATAAASCELRVAERSGISQDAEREVEGLATARADRLAAFTARVGWRVVVVAAGGAPLWPQGFDPLNMALLAEGGVLHTRFLKLGNDAGSLEAVDGEADLESFTEAAGAHPLFNGLRRATVVLATEPEVSDSGGTVTVRSPGFSASFRGTAKQSAQSITITLSPPSDSP